MSDFEFYAQYKTEDGWKKGEVENCPRVFEDSLFCNLETDDPVEAISHLIGSYQDLMHYGLGPNPFASYPVRWVLAFRGTAIGGINNGAPYKLGLSRIWEDEANFAIGMYDAEHDFNDYFESFTDFTNLGRAAMNLEPITEDN